MVWGAPAEEAEAVEGDGDALAFVADDAEDEGKATGEVEAHEYGDGGEGEGEVLADDAAGLGYPGIAASSTTSSHVLA